MRAATAELALAVAETWSGTGKWLVWELQARDERDGTHLATALDTSLRDALTGERKYEGGRPPVPATFFASPVAYDGKILLTSEDGDSFLIKAGPVHEVLATGSVGEPV